MKDAGLQPERTGLAWSRTGLLTMLVALLSVRFGLSLVSLLHLGAAALLGWVGVLLLHRGHVRAGYEDAGEAGVVTLPVRRLAGATSLAVVTAALLLAVSAIIRLWSGPG